MGMRIVQLGDAWNTYHDEVHALLAAVFGQLLLQAILFLRIRYAHASEESVSLEYLHMSRQQFTYKIHKHKVSQRPTRTMELLGCLRG